MPRADDLKSSFILGELDPLAKGNVRSDQYKAASDYLLNWLPISKHALISRMGSRYVATAQTSSERVLLIPFIFSKDDAYMLEMTSGNVRVYKNRAIVAGPVDLSPNTPSEPFFDETQYVQQGDSLFITRRGDTLAYPTVLQRVDDDSWNVGSLRYFPTGSTSTRITGPFLDADATAVAASMTMTYAGLLAIGSNGTVTASAAYFDADQRDEGRQMMIRGNAGNWTVYECTSWVSTTVLNVTVIGPVAADATGYAAPTWRMGVIYNSGLNSLTEGPRAIGFYQNRFVMGGYPRYPNRFDMSQPGLYNNFMPFSAAGTVESTSAISGTLAGPTVDDIVWFRETDYGLLCGTIGGERVIKGTPDSPILSPAASPPNITSDQFSNYGSKPRRVVPIGDSTVFISLSNKLREIRWTGNKFETVEFSESGEHLLSPAVGHLAVQENPQRRIWASVLKQPDYTAPRGFGTTFGPVDFDHRDNAKTQAVAGLYANSGELFGAARIQLGGVGTPASDPPFIESVATLPSPDGTREDVWLAVRRYVNSAFVRTLEFLTPDFEQHQSFEEPCYLDSSVSISARVKIASATKANPCVITLAVRDSSSKFSNGQTVRFENIEGMTQLNSGTYTLANKVSGTFNNQVTFELSGTNSTAYGTFIESEDGVMKRVASTVTGLTHLEGQTVNVVADGLVRSNAVVSAGAISLGATYADIHVGYKFNCDLRLLPPDAGSAMGTAVGNTQRCHRVSVKVDRLVNLKVGKDFDNLFELRPSLTSVFTGELSENVDVDYGLGNKVCIRKDQPLPGAILAVTQHLQTNDR